MIIRVNVKIGPLQIGPVTMFINTGIDVGCNLNLSAAGSLSYGFNSAFGTEFGAEYHRDSDPRWSNIFDNYGNFNPYTPTFDFSGSMNTRAYIIPYFSLEIADVAGPYLEVEPYLRGDFSISNQGWDYLLAAGIDSRIGFAVEIFGFELANYSYDFPIKEWVIANNSGSLPQVTTFPITNITKFAARSGGEVVNDGGMSVSSRGVCWNTAGSPTIGNNKTSDGSGTGSFTSNITGLSENTTYYVRAYATNSFGSSYGEQKQFTTDRQAGLPSIITANVTNITSSSAQSGGNVTDDGGATVTTRGVCWNTVGSPTTGNDKTTDGTGTGVFTSSLAGLSTNTTYYVRAYATNSVGTNYGNQKQFTTESGSGLDSFTDSRDGKTYKYIIIGNQTWMAENLAYLPSVSPSSEGSYTENHYYVYEYESTSTSSAKGTNNFDEYGVLYNWEASKTACPSGWHLPSDEEWKTFEKHLGMSSTDADNTALRSSGDVWKKNKIHCRLE